jgi:DNA repair protein RecO (recombination protein O)
VRQLLTAGIVLTRTDYGESDRIVTMLTPDYGKIRLMARGVRKVKSRLAGGIELFSVSDIGFMAGRGELNTLVSSRLVKHYGLIVRDIERVQAGYALIKMLNKATEDQPEPEYFELLKQTLAALDDDGISLELVRLWFQAQLLLLSGHMPNLSTAVDGAKLSIGSIYEFDFDRVAFIANDQGLYTTSHIKTLRLLFSHHQPAVLSKIQGIASILPDLSPLVTSMLTTYIRT